MIEGDQGKTMQRNGDQRIEIEGDQSKGIEIRGLRLKENNAKEWRSEDCD